MSSTNKMSKKYTGKNGGVGFGVEKYSGTIVMDEKTNKPVYFIRKDTDVKIPFLPLEDPHYEEQDHWLEITLPSEKHIDVIARWSPECKGILPCGGKFEILYDVGRVSMSYEPTDKTVQVVKKRFFKLKK